MRGLLEVGDPEGEVRTAWHAKETQSSPTTATFSCGWPTRTVPTRRQRSYLDHLVWWPDGIRVGTRDLRWFLEEGDVAG